MEGDNRIAIVADLMQNFAANTGLTGPQEPKRYLWTDAFAVCNFLEIHRRTGDNTFLDLAVKLVNQVHHVLGRHRPDDPRSGWISGLSESDGRKHPTAGGLRIGKPLPERTAAEDFDQRLEWEREGQYYHYLTKWMQALFRLAEKTGDRIYATYARELAEAAHQGFTYTTEGSTEMRMYWKMSTDLSRPLVPAMGHYDPLDGYLTYLELEKDAPSELLKIQIEDMKKICQGRDWTTDDPLGLGGILCDSLRVARLRRDRKEISPLLEELLSAAIDGLRLYARQAPLRQHPEYRLAFRELGLAIGLHGIAVIPKYLTESTTTELSTRQESEFVEALLAYRGMGVEIEEYWLRAENQRHMSWTEHLDINMVMLATSLAPATFLGE